MRNYDIVGGKKRASKNDEYKVLPKQFFPPYFIFIIIMNLHIFHVHDWKQENPTKKMESTEKSFNF